MIYATIKRAEPKREPRNLFSCGAIISYFTIIYSVINVRPHDEGKGPISCRPQIVLGEDRSLEHTVPRWKKSVQRIRSHEVDNEMLTSPNHIATPFRYRQGLPDREATKHFIKRFVRSELLAWPDNG